MVQRYLLGFGREALCTARPRLCPPVKNVTRNRWVFTIPVDQARFLEHPAKSWVGAGLNEYEWLVLYVQNLCKLLYKHSIVLPLFILQIR